ncbi:hypothetical protein BH10PSE19_BH10PSE19_08540 [soil metagenome]
MQNNAQAMNGQLMLQEYVKGPTISVESITFQGRTKVLSITDYIKGNIPYFVVMDWVIF